LGTRDVLESLNNADKSVGISIYACRHRAEAGRRHHGEMPITIGREPSRSGPHPWDAAVEVRNHVACLTRKSCRLELMPWPVQAVAQDIGEHWDSLSA